MNRRCTLYCFMLAVTDACRVFCLTEPFRLVGLTQLCYNASAALGLCSGSFASNCRMKFLALLDTSAHSSPLKLTWPNRCVLNRDPDRQKPAIMPTDHMSYFTVSSARWWPVIPGKLSGPLKNSSALRGLFRRCIMRGSSFIGLKPYTFTLSKESPFLRSRFSGRKSRCKTP